MRDRPVVTYRDTQLCTCTGRLLAGARHSPGALTNREVVRPCGQIVRNNIREGGEGTRNPGAWGLSAFLWLRAGAGFLAARGAVFAGVTGFLLEREVVAELAAVMMTSAVFESKEMSWKVELSNISL